MEVPRSEDSSRRFRMPIYRPIAHHRLKGPIRNRLAKNEIVKQTQYVRLTHLEAEDVGLRLPKNCSGAM